MKQSFSTLLAMIFLVVGKSSAVSNSSTRFVTVIDAATIKPITNILVGEVSERLNPLDLKKIK